MNCLKIVKSVADLKKLKDIFEICMILIDDAVANEDLHIGNPSFNKDLFKQMLKTIKPLKNRRIYLLGDMLENQNLDTFSINDFDFSIFCRHGKGSSKTKPLAMGKLERDTEHIVADMYLEGHNHKNIWWSEFKRFPTGYKQIFYGYCGHFLGYDGYPDQQYLQLEPPSWQLITINQNRLVKCHQYFAEID